jgi:predicted N-formylglutamate amidohydrolase
VDDRAPPGRAPAWLTPTCTRCRRCSAPTTGDLYDPPAAGRLAVPAAGRPRRPAGARCPRRPGLAQAELDRHIGWDIGIAGTTRALAERLDAWAIEQTYSRLLIDCNRPLASPTLIPEVSDHTVVPGNAGLSAAQRQQRIDAIHAPYHARIDAELDAPRCRPPHPAGDDAQLHPGDERHAAAVACRRAVPPDTRFAHALLQALRDEGDLVVGDNEPYSVSSTSDYAVPVHGEGRGLVHVELEIRQDLIADAAGQQVGGAAGADLQRAATGLLALG